MKTVMVSGSRDWENRVLLVARFRLLPSEFTRLIHGDARGADRMAADVAYGLGITPIPFRADWARFPGFAGFKRNIEMLEEGPDLLLAFQRNRSKGTQHAIDEARVRGIPVEIFKS